MSQVLKLTTTVPLKSSNASCTLHVEGKDWWDLTLKDYDKIFVLTGSDIKDLQNFLRRLLSMAELVTEY